ncbi:hypothetical protein [Mesorhizobium sp. B2-8-9]|uniref:hypothetical protein n=1 Tax=Mesorhizobium sp. B2-8-9 TaxID=2589899 RepID=UPI00112A33B6|nr:hypothetical protein [Mesorhizobium sp. B2-8-9]TPI85482.1 hypothetical protein FJ423_03995 [Mesorhizobium sp. B2-8-9]
MFIAGLIAIATPSLGKAGADFSKERSHLDSAVAAKVCPLYPEQARKVSIEAQCGKGPIDCDRLSNRTAAGKFEGSAKDLCVQKYIRCYRNVDDRNRSAAAYNTFIEQCRSQDKATPCDPATNAATVKEARDALDKVGKFITQIRAMGLQVPATFTGAVSTMEHAANAGVDLGEAAGQVDYEVQQIVKDKKKLCVDNTEGEAACEARIDRQWQQRNVQATLDWSNTHSVFRRVVDKWAGNHCPRK